MNPVAVSAWHWDQVLWLALVVVLGQSFGAHAQRAITPEHPQGQWEVLQRCRLNTNAVVDGDSFRVIHKGREYGFRLYFVDAPETDATLVERIQDQADYFKIAKEDVLRAGKTAARFIRERLTGRDLTIQTRWQNALGRGAVARFYCELLVGQTNLGEALVANGLARIHGQQTVRFDGTRGDAAITALKQLETSARDRGRGIWNSRDYPRMTSSSAKDGSTGLPTLPKSQAPQELLDLNSATLEELLELPDIGRTLARRIIEHRPFKTVNELEKVEGIGAKRLELLKPLVRVGRKAQPKVSEKQAGDK